jgi:REP element-mobilizing transposase RayT
MVRLMPGHSSLRRGRSSEPGATYFLTICTVGDHAGLTADKIASAIHEEIDRMIIDQVWDLRAATLMPDHVHLLARLGERLTLSQAIGRMKAKTKPALSGVDLAWHDSYYDHKLGPDEAVQSVVHYIFMNPYRAGIVSPGSSWPWFRLGKDESEWFTGLYSENVPMPAWLT